MDVAGTAASTGADGAGELSAGTVGTGSVSVGRDAGVRMLGPADIRNLADHLGVAPTKRLGQNFVHDHNTVRRIAQIGGVTAGDVVLEVGPGLGSLTLALLERGAQVVAVELDARLAAALPATVARMTPGLAAHCTVIPGDALALRDLPRPPDRLVANLPYNISVPVLLHLVETFPSLRTGLVMVQAEVGFRLAAGPGSRVYGAPSVKAAWWGAWTTVGTVSRQVFWPVPNVDSVLIRFERQAEPDAANRARTFALIDAAFGQRRKMLRQSLAATLGPAVGERLAAAGIAETARGEALSLAEFVALARVWAESS